MLFRVSFEVSPDDVEQFRSARKRHEVLEYWLDVLMGYKCETRIISLGTEFVIEFLEELYPAAALQELLTTGEVPRLPDSIVDGLPVVTQFLEELSVIYRLIKSR